MSEVLKSVSGLNVALLQYTRSLALPFLLVVFVLMWVVYTVRKLFFSFGDFLLDNSCLLTVNRWIGSKIYEDFLQCTLYTVQYSCLCQSAEKYKALCPKISPCSTVYRFHDKKTVARDG